MQADLPIAVMLIHGGSLLDAQTGAVTMVAPGGLPRQRPLELACGMRLICRGYPGSVQLRSPSFTHGTTIPTKHTCDGLNVSPELTWADLPSGARSLALRVLDPDAPSGTFTHWLIWDLDPRAGGIREGRVPEEAREGKNGFGDVGYGGPCPPARRGVHHYHFELIALREPIILDQGASREAFDAAVRDQRLEVAELVGLYERR